VRAILLSALFIILLMAPAWAQSQTSAFGLRSQEQCDSDPTITRPSQLMSCYRAAAITYAYAQNDEGKEKAKTLCYLIGASQSTTGNSKSDVATKAYMMSDECYFAVAKITRDPGVCAKIGGTPGEVKIESDTGLFGATVSRDICLEEAGNLARLAPQNYYTDPKNTNICMMVSILPLLVFGAYRYGNARADI